MNKEVSATEYGKMHNITKAAVCQRIRKYNSLKGAKRVRKVGKVYVITLEN